MNSLSSKRRPFTDFLLSLSSPSSRTLCVSLFSTSSHSLSSSAHSSSRRHDEESRNVRVSVWWDIENCCVPAGINVFKIAQSITTAVRVNGIKGPVQISAFGDVFRLPRAIQEGLSITGINLVHVPNGGKNSADRLILVDLMSWVSQNPPPAHIFLISSDRDFAGVLHRLRMSNYNILLAGAPGVSSAALCSASSIMWNWSELARGENFSGRHFNQPPDGPFNSWYGQYRGALENPFEVLVQQNNSPKASDSSNEEISSEKDHQVPKAVLKHIRRIVNSYPYGVSSTELRAQLTRSQVNIDRDYYGYRKFSRFLMSIPHIIRAVPSDDGLLILRPVSSKVRKPVEGDDIPEGPITKNGTRDVQMGAKASDKKTCATTRTVEIEPMLTVSSYNDAKEKVVEEKVGETAENKKKLHETSVKLDSLSEDEVASKMELQGKETSDARVTNSSETHSEEQDPKSEMGLFRKLWTKWFSSRKDAEETKPDIPDKVHASESSSEGSISKEEPTKSSNQNEICARSLSSSSDALSTDAKSSVSYKSEDSEGFVAKVISWFRPWSNESPVDTLTGQSIQEPSVMEESSKHEDGQNIRKHEVFSDDSFWCAIESFLKTYNGSRIVLKSTSREQFAGSLQNEGPLILGSLQESDLLHLVDLLVSEKKWIRESPSKIPRFRIILPPEKSPATSQPLNVNGLSSIFLSSSQGKPHSGFSSIVHKTSSKKSRVEILTDCRKLFDELLEQNPEGFNTGGFRKQFIEKYGYPLDHRKLGYSKLSSLLQIMPRVKTQSRPRKVFPEAKSSGSDSEMNDLPQKHEDNESPWEELGPVSKNSILSKQGEGSKSDQEGFNNVYEPCKSEDDEFSDVEEEECSLTNAQAEEQRKSRVNEDESSLLQILDSWHSSKDERSSSDHTRDLESLEDCPKKETSPSELLSHTGDKDEVSNTVNHARKERPQKSYIFVSDHGERQRQGDQCHFG